MRPAHERYVIEQGDQPLKEELGPDHTSRLGHFRRGLHHQPKFRS